MKTTAEKQETKGVLLPKDLGIVKKKVQVDVLPPKLINQITSYVADNYGVLRLVNLLEGLGKLRSHIYYLSHLLEIIDEISLHGISVTFNNFGSENDDYSYKESESAVVVNLKIRLKNHMSLYRYITGDYDTKIELIENSELYKILGREAENKFIDCLITYFKTINYVLYNDDLIKLPIFISDKMSSNDNILVFKDVNKDELNKHCSYYVVLEFVRNNN